MNNELPEGTGCKEKNTDMTELTTTLSELTAQADLNRDTPAELPAPLHTAEPAARSASFGRLVVIDIIIRSGAAIAAFIPRAREEAH
jgi:hypothetical protein